MVAADESVFDGEHWIAWATPVPPHDERCLRLHFMSGTCEWYRCVKGRDHGRDGHIWLYDAPGDCSEE